MWASFFTFSLPTFEAHEPKTFFFIMGTNWRWWLQQCFFYLQQKQNLINLDFVYLFLHRRPYFDWHLVKSWRNTQTSSYSQNNMVKARHSFIYSHEHWGKIRLTNSLHFIICLKTYFKCIANIACRNIFYSSFIQVHKSAFYKLKMGAVETTAATKKPLSRVHQTV